MSREDEAPPPELLAAMGTEPINVLCSILCLAAALAVQRGEKGPISIEACEASGIPVDEQTRAFLIEVAHKAVELYKGETPRGLASAVELYAAHIKFCGYSAEWGTTN